jgi:hypothetical protein
MGADTARRALERMRAAREAELIDLANELVGSGSAVQP